ncbi:MAG: hypothetical protein ACTSUE_19530 [Promethearchaeota archaeon]
MNGLKMKKITILKLLVLVTIPLLSFVQLHNARATTLHHDPAGEGWEILPGETQYYAIWNDNSTVDITINMTYQEIYTPNTPGFDYNLQVFTWDEYRPWQSLGISNNSSVDTTCSVNFTCLDSTRYIVRIKNLDDDDTGQFQITFTTNESADIYSNGYILEQQITPGKIAVNFYGDTDPWLFDSPTSTDRATIMIGYQVYGALRGLSPFPGERYFSIYNEFQDVELFVGIVTYPFPSSSTGVHTLAVYDWAELDAGNITAIKIDFTFNNYSIGFNFTCKKGHTYQAWFQNGDSIDSLFINATFYAFGVANVRFDNDLDPEPPTDQIRVRAHLENPWLAQRSEKREIWKWILGIGGVTGASGAVSVFFLKRRYS